MPKYTIYYFPPRGPTVAARMMMFHAGVDFKDVVLTFDEWPKYKPTSPNGTIPILDVDGHKLSQTVAIHNYLARELGYYGSTNLECAEIDQVVQTANEFFNDSKKSFFPPAEKREEMFKRHYEELLPKYAAFFTRILKTNKTGSGFFVGSKLTVADFEVFDVIHIAEKKNKGALDKYPEVKNFYQKMAAIPKIKEYMALKPDALM